MTKKLIEINNLIKCEVLKRINKFVVEIKIKNQKTNAYINNTGKLEGILKGEGFCIKNNGKLPYKLIYSNGFLIDTKIHEKAVEISINKGFLSLPKVLKRQVKLFNSKIDFLLEDGTFLEVKSAVLNKNGLAMYPDTKTKRGEKHILDLIKNVENGGKSVILFVAGFNAKAFSPSPILKNLIVKAKEKGVNLKAISLELKDNWVVLINENLPVIYYS